MRRLLPGVIGLALLCCGVAVAQQKEPIVLALHADMSSGSALAGEAIRRGALLAISEINAQGGLLGGRKLELVVRDHHGVPARATEQLPELAGMPHLVAILSGLHSPPVIQNLGFIHEHQLIILSPWAAATGVVHHELRPNYTFRVSVDDARVGEFLVAQALARGHGRLALILEKTAWGRSNDHDAVWLFALAIQKAKSTERARVRDALERLGPYQGLVRTYQPAFTPSNHEALSSSDFKLATFNPRGVQVPAQP
ncbi:MAG TPA: ABC transporter substrate-binding protein [Archangium sp.]|jgi:branched-chain amino acid transport system substrate-binding protein